jgi:hypothetical protein
LIRERERELASVGRRRHRRVARIEQHTSSSTHRAARIEQHAAARIEQHTAAHWRAAHICTARTSAVHTSARAATYTSAREDLPSAGAHPLRACLEHVPFVLGARPLRAWSTSPSCLEHVPFVLGARPLLPVHTRFPQGAHRTHAGGHTRGGHVRRRSRRSR